MCLRLAGGKGDASGAGGVEGIWAGMPQPRIFTGALSLFEQVRLVRNNSKGWLSLSQRSDPEPVSEDTRSDAIDRVFRSPLPYVLARSRGEAGSAAAVPQQGGLLMEALMGRDSDTVVASLLRRAQGEHQTLLPVEVPEQPLFDDGWAHDEYAAVLVSLSTQQHVPPASKELAHKTSHPGGGGRRGGAGAAKGGCREREQDGDRAATGLKREEAVWVKAHAQPLRVRVSLSAMQCLQGLMQHALRVQSPPRTRSPEHEHGRARASEHTVPSHPPSLAASPKLPPAHAASAVKPSPWDGTSNGAPHRRPQLVQLDLLLAGGNRYRRL